MNLDFHASTAGNRNARITHIRNFVSKMPKHAHALRLVTIEDPPMILGEWPADGCEENLMISEDVDGRLREHADTVGGAVGATLSWNTEGGQLIHSKRLNVKALDPAMDPSESARNEALGISGAELGREVQRQRHYEAMIRSYMAAHQTQIAQAQQARREDNADKMEMMRLMSGMLSDAYKANHAAQLELDKLRAEQRMQIDKMMDRLHAQAAALERHEPSDPEAAVKAEFMKDAGKMVLELVPFFVEKLAEKYGGLPSEGSPNTNGAPANTSASASASTDASLMDD